MKTNEQIQEWEIQQEIERSSWNSGAIIHSIRSQMYTYFRPKVSYTVETQLVDEIWTEVGNAVRNAVRVPLVANISCKKLI
jgi:hypothetical protein